MAWPIRPAGSPGTVRPNKIGRDTLTPGAKVSTGAIKNSPIGAGAPGDEPWNQPGAHNASRLPSTAAEHLRGPGK